MRTPPLVLSLPFPPPFNPHYHWLTPRLKPPSSSPLPAQQSTTPAFYHLTTSLLQLWYHTPLARTKHRPPPQHNPHKPLTFTVSIFSQQDYIDTTTVCIDKNGMARGNTASISGTFFLFLFFARGMAQPDGKQPMKTAGGGEGTVAYCGDWPRGKREGVHCPPFSEFYLFVRSCRIDEIKFNEME